MQSPYISSSSFPGEMPSSFSRVRQNSRYCLFMLLKSPMVGVTRQTINAIEKGDYNPTINLCIAICKELGKTLDELFWE